MNKKAILHVADSNYCYAINNNTVEILLRTDKDDKFDEVNVIYGNKYDYYKKQLQAQMKLRFTDENFNYYFLRLQLADVRFVYIFKLTQGQTTVYFCEDGVVENYDFSVAYFNSFQLPYINTVDVIPTVGWLTNAVFYQIFVDRFCCGDDKKDKSYVNLKWGEIPTPKSFAGGDIAGIISKLDYLQSLGVTALYLTPVFQSKSNHKYDVSNYYRIDPHFGTESQFKTLVQQAHKRGIKVVLDAVFNHCSEDLAQFQDVVRNGRDSEFFDWFIVDGDTVDTEKGNYEYFGVCKYMPKFNTSCESLQQYLIGVATHWIKNYDIDGWRLDVSDEVSHDFWRKFRTAVKKVKSDAVLLGENWHDAYPYLRGDEYDGIMNYAVTKALMDYFVFDALDSDGLAKRFSALFVRNKRQINYMMLNLLDSHDTHRFFSLVKEDESKLVAALAIIFCHCGSTCIYYGTEVPLSGGHDPDCRRTMDWSVEQTPTAIGKLIKQLALLKKEEIFATGEINYYGYDNKFVLERTLGEKTVRLTVSKNSTEFQPRGRVLLSNNYCNGKIDGVGFIIEEVTL